MCVITTRIRKMGEGTVFSLFVSPHLDPPIRSNSASTCYPAGGMPLAFKQEDYLVYHTELLSCKNIDFSELYLSNTVQLEINTNK